MAPVHAPSGLHTKSLSSSHMNGMERNVEIVWVLLAALFSLGNALHVGSNFCLYEFTELNFLSVGSRLAPPGH